MLHVAVEHTAASPFTMGLLSIDDPVLLDMKVLVRLEGMDGIVGKVDARKGHVSP